MIYKHLLKPILFKQDAEKAHDWAIHITSKTHRSPFLQALVSSVYGSQDVGLGQEFFGCHFPNPIGLAAGFDKNGTTPLAIQALGFGFVEVGSVTAKASKGNPKPRAFRIPDDHSLINRMGLNNEGADSIIKRISGYHTELNIPLGINIAKTNDASIHGDAAIQDYLYSYEKAQPYADYTTVNISCPNTGEGKTFEDPLALKDLLEALAPQKEGRKPSLVKFTPDIDRANLKQLIQICEDFGIAGYVATNTSSNRSELKTPSSRLQEIGNGGLSGRAIQKKSTEVISWIHDITEGKKLIIGVGGIDSVESAVEKLQAGANLLQIYTGLVYEGPALASRIKRGINLKS